MMGMEEQDPDEQDTAGIDAAFAIAILFSVAVILYACGWLAWLVLGW